MRTTASAAALIEQDDSIGVRVEKTAGAGVASGAGAAMNEYRRLAARIAAFLVVDLVHVGNAQMPGPVGLHGGIERAQARRAPRRALALGQHSVTCVAALLAGAQFSEPVAAEPCACWPFRIDLQALPDLKHRVRRGAAKDRRNGKSREGRIKENRSTES